MSDYSGFEPYTPVQPVKVDLHVPVEYREPLAALREMGLETPKIEGGFLRDLFCGKAFKDIDMSVSTKTWRACEMSIDDAADLILKDWRFRELKTEFMAPVKQAGDGYGYIMLRRRRLQCEFVTKAGNRLPLDITIFSEPVSPAEMSLNADAPINSAVIDLSGNVIADPDFEDHCKRQIYHLRTHGISAALEGARRFKRIRDRAYPKMRFEAPAKSVGLIAACVARLAA
ncbi:MAG: hypothetical protein KGQ41_03005 [Alphaproteobacteria bacterium]|nr:hypothetical protein [Alphaproteobacteria bacterium]